MKEERITRIRLDPSKPVETDWSRADAMTDEEVHAAALSDPDCPPMTEEQLVRMTRGPSPRIVRFRLGLSQEEFAQKFHLPIEMIRDWEEGRQKPDAVAKLLLRVIGSNPEAVIDALTPPPRPAGPS